MPKQRSHPHHHSAAEREASQEGLQLPQPTYAVKGMPTWIYPAGWVKRPFWRSRSTGVRILGFAWAAFLLLALIIAILSHFG